MKESEMEPTALATDVGKGIPILEGEAAERFLKLAKEAEDKAILNDGKEKTLKELKKDYNIKKMLVDFRKRELNEMERELEELERQIELKRINGED